MFIQTEPMPDINRMKFYPGEPVLVSGTLEFSDKEAAERSPLVSRLFEIEGVMQVTLYDEFVTVKKQENFNWQVLKPMILGAIMDHYSTGKPTLLEIKDPKEELEFNIKDLPEDAETINQIQEIINTRIKPAAEQMGGAVTYKAFNKGTLYVELTGPTMALVGGMTNVIGHHVPQVTAV
ncbi:MAG TPA: NifU family protein, partial [Rhodospirillales bacterium]|nr:NifU family protein [Rhodospirillales bacterium]